MGAVFKTVSEFVRASLGGFDSHTPPPLRFGNGDLGLRISCENMTQDEMKARTRQFALRVIKLVESLPGTRAANTIGHQLLRCGTSVGANYRSACRAKSTADFISKLSIVEEEADESIYWMELLVESGTVREDLLNRLIDEANQIVSIIVKSIKTSKLKRNPKSQTRNPKSI